MMTCGSRGDIQPYIAMACALKDEGYEFQLLTNLDHEKFLKDFDITFKHMHPAADHALQTDPDLIASMQKGDTMSFIKGLGSCFKRNALEMCEKFTQHVKEFKPDLIISGTLSDYFGAYAWMRMGLPTIFVKLQVLLYNPKRMSFGMPTLPCGAHKFIMNQLIFGGMYKDWKELDVHMGNLYGRKLQDEWTLDMFLDDVAKGGPYFNFVCQSPEFKEALYPTADENVKLIGACIINAKTQQKVSRNFGGDTAAQKIQSFLDNGPKPVYCGWGSMTCKSPEFMVELVVKALMRSGQRAVVLGGWAGLSLECLKKATQDKDLVTYAEQKILFVENAPHEILFPQVSCAVHHGGAGTMTSVMRAGVPNIITPVFLDQWDHAYLVNELGVGIGCAKQFQRITAEELGDTITKVLGNQEIASKAKALGEKLMKEDGIKQLVTAVNKFWVDEVETKNFQAKVDARRAAMAKTKESCLAGCFAGMCGTSKRV